MSETSPLPVPTLSSDVLLATPAPGKASLAGRLVDAQTNRPMVNQAVSLPSVICPPDVAEAEKRTQCVYAVDEAFDPSVLTDDAGQFMFRDIKAGDYVMLVGNPATRYTVLSNQANQPLIWSAQANQVLNVGDLVVELR